VNTVGSYFCVCKDNYILYPRDGASCQKRAAEPPRVPNQRLSSAVGVSFLFMVLTGAAGFGLYKYRMRVRSTPSVELALLCNLVHVAASFAVQYLFPGLSLGFRPCDTDSCIQFFRSFFCSCHLAWSPATKSVPRLSDVSKASRAVWVRELSGSVLRLPTSFTVCMSYTTRATNNLLKQPTGNVEDDL
jgi:hypothetical protein